MNAGPEQALRGLVEAEPDQPAHWLQLTALLERQGDTAGAETYYRRLIERLPELPVARFNLACFLRRRGRLDEALQEHQKALDLGIDGPEEILSNMGVIYTELRRDEPAKTHFERALAIRPAYIPAQFNLALLHEEMGEWPQALGLFEKILEQDPAYTEALVRIAHARRANPPDDPIIRRLQRALRRATISPPARENLHFALGKVLDDCGRFDEAFDQYRLGNQLSTLRLLPYDTRAEEARVERILTLFNADWLARATPVSDRPLVFITGMFRSGSTLFEQVLAAHPRVTAGGEIDYFHRELLRPGTRFPDSIATIDPEEWQRLGAGYLEHLDRTFPGAGIVTDKRPDLFPLLGLLRAMYPNARFVNTVRDARDTCLSIWFQQFDGRLGYANDLSKIAHHYRQYRRLLAHWRKLFGERIFDADYDSFVADPRPVASALCEFLGLEWHEDCLAPERTANRVRTASVAQVREPLYRRSSGRWRNYARQIAKFERQL
ncbi:MAG: sulfotransferase [Steroidobacteraceae bacterium]